jgi:hypothetical protein
LEAAGPGKPRDCDRRENADDHDAHDQFSDREPMVSSRETTKVNAHAGKKPKKR